MPREGTSLKSGKKSSLAATEGARLNKWRRLPSPGRLSDLSVPRFSPRPNKQKSHELGGSSLRREVSEQSLGSRNRKPRGTRKLKARSTINKGRAQSVDGERRGLTELGKSLDVLAVLKDDRAPREVAGSTLKKKPLKRTESKPDTRCSWKALFSKSTKKAGPGMRTKPEAGTNDHGEVRLQQRSVLRCSVEQEEEKHSADCVESLKKAGLESEATLTGPTENRARAGNKASKGEHSDPVDSPPAVKGRTALIEKEPRKVATPMSSPAVTEPLNSPGQNRRPQEKRTKPGGSRLRRATSKLDMPGAATKRQTEALSTGKQGRPEMTKEQRCKVATPLFSPPFTEPLKSPRQKVKGADNKVPNRRNILRSLSNISEAQDKPAKLVGSRLRRRALEQEIKAADSKPRARGPKAKSTAMQAAQSAAASTAKEGKAALGAAAPSADKVEKELKGKGRRVPLQK